MSCSVTKCDYVKTIYKWSARRIAKQQFWGCRMRFSARCIIMNGPAVLLFSVWLPRRSFSLFMWIAKGFNSRRLSRLEGGPTRRDLIASEFSIFSLRTSRRRYIDTGIALHIALLIIANRDYNRSRFIGTPSFFITTENRNATYGASRGYERYRVQCSIQLGTIPPEPYDRLKRRFKSACRERIP